MKITNDKSINVLDAVIKSASQKTTNKKDDVAGKALGDIPDKVELSKRKEEVDRIKEKVKVYPAVRQDKVDKIKEAIKSETYNVNGKLIAKSIIQSNLLDEIL
ncbi:MAG: flagellar biosynthesis anti-sigma factor FlgM [Syntrophorhabdaceae bacterium]|nr:flagellar biosynthesis anti-sigma factor FlgM [Syntrophorhabdaceae bacterium]